MKKLIAALAMTLYCGSAFAACSQEEAQKKVMDMSTKLQQLIMKDPSKAQHWQAKAVEMQQKSSSISSPDEACAYLDEIIKEIENDMN